MKNIIKFSEYKFNESNQPGYTIDELKKNKAESLKPAKKVDGVSSNINSKGKPAKDKNLKNTLSDVEVKYFNKKSDVVQKTNNEVLPEATNTNVKTFDNFFKTTTEKTKKVKGKENNLL